MTESGVIALSLLRLIIREAVVNHSSLRSVIISPCGIPSALTSIIILIIPILVMRLITSALTHIAA